MTDNIIELHRHAPDVESVVSRLEWHKDKIENLVVYVEWADSDIPTLSYNTMPIKDLLWMVSYMYEALKQKALFDVDHD